MAYLDDDDETGEIARNARGCIIEAAWKKTVTDDIARALSRPGPRVGIIIVPGPTWVRPIERRTRDLLGEGWVAIAHEARPKDLGLERGNLDLLSHLDNGKDVVGIAPVAGMLPGALVAAADFTIVVARPDASVVGAAIRTFLGRRSAPSNCPGAGALDLPALAACFRGGSARAIVARIERATGIGSATAGEPVPSLTDAVEWGEAREWGLTVSADMKRFLSGQLPWLRIENSVILHSIPGLGKTTLCESLARHMGATLVTTSVSELFATSSGYLDGVIKSLRQTYTRAEANIPAVILWDEIDALPSRVGLDSRAASWWSSVITDFMLMVSQNRPGVVQIAATNFVDRIDPALRRPGRFGRAIELLPPNAAGIVSMLRFQLGSELAGADLSEIGELAAGSTAAEAMAIVRRARGIARAADRGLRVGDLLDATVPPVTATPADLRRIAFHESGHAVVGIALGVDELTSVQIGGLQGSGLGSTKHRRLGELETRVTIEDRVTMMLGGRAAEQICCGAISSGSHSDLTAATARIGEIHTALGLGDTLAAFDVEDLRRGWLDAPLRAVIERELRRLQDRAIDVVATHRAAVEAMAEALMQRRFLTGAAARRIFAAHRPSRPGATTAGRETGC